MKRISYLLAMALVSCGGDDGNPGGSEELAGLYKVDAISVDPQGCGPGTAPAQIPAYLQIKKSDVLGAAVYGFRTCQSADAATCTGNFGLPLYELSSAGGAGYISSAAASGSSCTLQDTQATFTVMSGALRHEQRTYRQNNVTGAPCTQDEAHQRGATMPCVAYELATATRVSK